MVYRLVIGSRVVVAEKEEGRKSECTFGHLGLAARLLCSLIPRAGWAGW